MIRSHLLWHFGINERDSFLGLWKYRWSKTMAAWYRRPGVWIFLHSPGCTATLWFSTDWSQRSVNPLALRPCRRSTTDLNSFVVLFHVQVSIIAPNDIKVWLMFWGSGSRSRRRSFLLSWFLKRGSLLADGPLSVPTDSMSWLVCGAVWVISSHLPQFRLVRTMKGITRSGGQCGLMGSVILSSRNDSWRRFKSGSHGTVRVKSCVVLIGELIYFTLNQGSIDIY